MRLSLRHTGILVVMLAASPWGAAAQSVLTQGEALELAFPPPLRVERRTAFLSEKLLDSARALVGGSVEIRQTVVTYYVGLRGDVPVGVAYFDAHVVRTVDEVLLVVVSPDDAIERLEILRFSEPPEYRAPDGWLQQFPGRRLSDGLSLRGGIVGITGATLTAEAITAATRRVLALHRVIHPISGRAER